MFDKSDNAEPRVTLIDPDNNYYTITDFYGKFQYGTTGSIGVVHEEFPDELDDLDGNDLEGWAIVVTEKVNMSCEETETKSSNITGAGRKSDGWLIEYGTA